MLHNEWQSIAMGLAGTPAAQGVVWLPDYAVSTFQGPDVSRFLQGYLTCDVASLQHDRAQPAALCNIKGRVVVNGWAVSAAPDQVRLLHDRSLSPVLGDLLAVYLRFSKTRLIDHSAELLVFGALDLPDLPGAVRADARRQWLLLESSAAARTLVQTTPTITASAWQRALIADGIATVTAATRDQCLPQMLDLPRIGAVSFDKGCYLGQEIVARAQHRGQVKRHLVRMIWQGDGVPDAGATLTDASGQARGVLLQAAGEETSGTAQLNETEGHQGTALAVLQDDSIMPLTAGGCRFDSTERCDGAS